MKKNNLFQILFKYQVIEWLTSIGTEVGQSTTPTSSHAETETGQGGVGGTIGNTITEEGGGGGGAEAEKDLRHTKLARDTDTGPPGSSGRQDDQKRSSSPPTPVRGQREPVAASHFSPPR